MAGDRETVSPTLPNVINVDRFRKLVTYYLDKHHYQTALFWADKIVSLTNGNVQDVYRLSHCLYLTGQYHRAAYCLKNQQLHKKHLACRYLASLCLFACKEYQEALDVLDLMDGGIKNFNHNNKEDGIEQTEIDDGIFVKNIPSSISLLRGRIYEAMDNRALAAECFRNALREDVYCYEAFEALIQHHMLSAQEEKELLDSLPFSKQCPAEEVQIIQFLYENKLKKYNKPSELVIPQSLDNLNGNLDIVVNLAERHYYNCDYKECFNITSAVLNKDPFHKDCLPIHIACLVELEKSNALFYLAHKLVDLYPESATAWFAVGCYYLVIGKNDPARRYLSKATTLDRVFGPAWLVYGHSFAIENEHDQAMAAYFKASQLMKGCHLPLLYIGLEYGLTNNPKLAERFFSQALTIAPEDPFVIHEMGVIAFHNMDWLTSEKYFKEALDKVQSAHHTVMVGKWEPLFNNLGQTCRKLKKYDEALQFHQQALVLSPHNPSTYSAIGYVHSLMGNYSAAVDYFHKALSLKRDDTFSNTMLSNVIEQLMNEMSPCEGAPSVVPKYEFPLDSTQSLILPDASIQESTENSNMMIEFEMD